MKAACAPGQVPKSTGEDHHVRHVSRVVHEHVPTLRNAISSISLMSMTYALIEQLALSWRCRRNLCLKPA